MFTRTEQILFALELVLVLYSFRLFSQLTTRLKQRYPETWQQLGSPSLFTGNSPATTAKVTSFVFGGRYRDLNDERITQLAGRWKLVYIVFICALAFLAYEILRYGP